MNANKRPMLVKLLFAGLTVSLAVAGYATAKAFAYKHRAEWEAAVSKQNLFLLNSYASALFCLATERYTVHEARNQTWIFHVHNSSENSKLQKYTDGKFTVVSVPAQDDMEIEGLRLYAYHYNAWVMHKADLLAMDGHYDDSLSLYKLIQRFGDIGCYSDQLAKKISLVEQLKAGVSVDSNKTALNSMINNYVHSVCDGLETAQPITVSNLFFNVKVRHE
jgi:hypothetical protein